MCDTVSRKLKPHLVSAPILDYDDFLKPFTLETDASMQRLGVVLSQIRDGKESVIAYYSRSKGT